MDLSVDLEEISRKGIQRMPMPGSGLEADRDAHLALPVEFPTAMCLKHPVTPA